MKLHVTVQSVPEAGIITSDKMIPGQIGLIRDSAAGTIRYFDEVVLRTFESLVLLSDPKCTWTKDVPVKVELLPPGTTIVIKTI